jgi:hypothetical protein
VRRLGTDEKLSRLGHVHGSFVLTRGDSALTVCNVPSSQPGNSVTQEPPRRRLAPDLPALRAPGKDERLSSHVRSVSGAVGRRRESVRVTEPDPRPATERRSCTGRLLGTFDLERPERSEDNAPITGCGRLPSGPNGHSGLSLSLLLSAGAPLGLAARLKSVRTGVDKWALTKWTDESTRPKRRTRT